MPPFNWGQVYIFDIASQKPIHVIEREYTSIQGKYSAKKSIQGNEGGARLRLQGEPKYMIYWKK